MTERCFITPTDSRQGLTISGFYFIALRREDGQIEGLYYDPGSSPYQQLNLSPKPYGHQAEPIYKADGEGSCAGKARRRERRARETGSSQISGMTWPAYTFR